MPCSRSPDAVAFSVADFLAADAIPDATLAAQACLAEVQAHCFQTDLSVSSCVAMHATHVILRPDKFRRASEQRPVMLAVELHRQVILSQSHRATLLTLVQSNRRLRSRLLRVRQLRSLLLKVQRLRFILPIRAFHLVSQCCRIRALPQSIRVQSTDQSADSMAFQSHQGSTSNSGSHIQGGSNRSFRSSHPDFD